MGILLQHLALAYGSRQLLVEASASVARGSLTALIGCNGTGKSTLLRTIAGFSAPISGQIRLCGKLLTDLDARQRATTVSFVATDKVRISNLRVEDLVALGRAPYTNWIGRLQETDRNMVYCALEQVGMASFANKAMDTLSDGEAQRVMIARALAQDTPIILLDEPTAFLDLTNRYQLVSLLRRLAYEEQKSILFSTHDLDAALTLCDQIMLLDTPHLYHLPTEDLIAQGLIDRLFTDGQLHFDPITRTVRFAGE